MSAPATARGRLDLQLDRGKWARFRGLQLQPTAVGPTLLDDKNCEKVPMGDVLCGRSPFFAIRVASCRRVRRLF
jgi:hypothetical protein